LLPQYERYLSRSGNSVLPRPEYISLLQVDIRDIASQVSLRKEEGGEDNPCSNAGAPAPSPVPYIPFADYLPCDLIFSRSVYEHLDDVEGITAALVSLTCSQGWHVHLIDLSDHFFKYPFEMLMYSPGTWRNWLNPTSNLNRLRYRDYQRVFEKYLDQVQITPMQRQPEAFEQARRRIRPEFLSGDAQIDAITYISVTGTASNHR
jgi:hypothetical protein